MPAIWRYASPWRDLGHNLHFQEAFNNRSQQLDRKTQFAVRTIFDILTYVDSQSLVFEHHNKQSRILHISSHSKSTNLTVKNSETMGEETKRKTFPRFTPVNSSQMSN